MDNSNDPPARTSNLEFSEEKQKIIKEWPYFLYYYYCTSHLKACYCLIGFAKWEIWRGFVQEYRDQDAVEQITIVHLFLYIYII